MTSGFRQPDVELTPDAIVGAALLAPSFSEDLSTWRMTIDRDGTVTQQLRPTYSSELYDAVCIHLRTVAEDKTIAQIHAVIDEIGFDTFADEYESDWTDLQRTSITVNLGGNMKRVAAYGPHELAREGHRDMIGYVRLWDLLAEISPYRHTTANVRPEQEVRTWLRDVFGLRL